MAFISILYRNTFSITHRFPFISTKAPIHLVTRQLACKKFIKRVKNLQTLQLGNTNDKAKSTCSKETRRTFQVLDPLEAWNAHMNLKQKTHWN